MIKKIFKIFLVLLCMLTIFILSNDSADESTKKSNSLIYKIGEIVTGHRLNNKEKEEAVEKFVFIVRKGAHFSIYLILGLLLISLIIEYKVLNYKTMLFALLISFLYAISDEVHQLFVPGRSCEIRDILIDTSGALVGVYFYYFICRIRRKNNE